MALSFFPCLTLELRGFIAHEQREAKRRSWTRENLWAHTLRVLWTRRSNQKPILRFLGSACSKDLSCAPRGSLAFSFASSPHARLWARKPLSSRVSLPQWDKKDMLDFTARVRRVMPAQLNKLTISIIKIEKKRSKHLVMSKSSWISPLHKSCEEVRRRCLTTEHLLYKHMLFHAQSKCRCTF